jgi:hypothetical protein
MRSVGGGVVALAVVFGAASVASSQSSLPRAPGAHVVTITPPGQIGNEPAIAVNRYSPNQVVVTYGGDGGVAYSVDSGRTFTIAHSPGGAGRDGGDNTITFDDKGHVFLAYQIIEKLGAWSYWGHGARGNGIWVRRSPDGGKTWDANATPVLVWPNGKPAPAQEDMPRIWADNEPTSPHRGNLYMAWIEWQIDKSIVLFTRSTDDGRTWERPSRISTHAGLPRDDVGAVLGIIGAVAPDGTQYIVWNESLHTVLAVSRDGGKTFAPSRSVFPVEAPYFAGATGVPGVSRVMGLPEIDIDRTRGTLYVTWSDFRNGDIDVFLARSADHGTTWSGPIRVNDNPVHDGTDQFYQWLAVDPSDGSLYVEYYDRREDPDNRKTSVTLARSTDGGRSFRSYMWSDAPFTGENAFLGDYIWLTAYGGRVYGAWAEAVPRSSGRTTDAPLGLTTLQGSPTVVRVGTADFTARFGGSASGQ